ncbi:cell filamentation protein Fic, partial [Streptococcus danieliae]|nr:cell filamentation protein Fic [Streptococcus danieliae]
MYISVKRAADSWGISDRRVRDLCSQGKVEGAVREGRSWKIPQDTPKPVDGRYKKAESLVVLIDQKMTKLASLRLLTQGEVERLNEEFMVEFTYNSNAIEGNTLT